MAKITNVQQDGIGVSVHFHYECGHSEDLFYAAEKYARMDKHMLSQHDCWDCRNTKLVAEFKKNLQAA